MKICIVNHRYFVSGGPERYMFGVIKLLEDRGHEVVPFSIAYRANRSSPWSPYFARPIAGDDEVVFRQQRRTPRTLWRTAERATYSTDVYRSLRRLVAAARPDVALVLHYLRKLSPAVLPALYDAEVPIVVRLSDFGMLCPQAHMMRDDRACESCLRDGLWQSVRYRCVQDSYAGSAVAAAALALTQRRGLFDLVETFIAPSETMRQKMLEAGYAHQRLVHLPTFVEARKGLPFESRRAQICYVGRLDRTKGVHILVQAMALLGGRIGPDRVRLVIAGDGDPAYLGWLQRLVAEGRIHGVTFVGALDSDAVLSLLGSSLVSVVPSLWYENLPNAMLESFACGTPVVASDLGSMHDTLVGADAGLLFAPGDPGALADALLAVVGDAGRASRMGEHARRLALERFAPGPHIDSLLDVARRARYTRSSRAPRRQIFGGRSATS